MIYDKLYIRQIAKDLNRAYPWEVLKLFSPTMQYALVGAWLFDLLALHGKDWKLAACDMFELRHDVIRILQTKHRWDCGLDFTDDAATTTARS